MQGVAFHPRPHATREVTEHIRVFVLHPPPDRDHITRPAVLRIDRGENMIEERPLVEVGVMRIRTQREEPARELEHIIHVARLGRASVHEVVQLIRLAEMFVFAMPTSGEAMMLYHAVPEEACSQDVLCIACVSEAIRRANHFGNLSVAVLAVKDILVAFKRFREGTMLKAAGQSQPAFVACIGIQVGQCFVHAAKLGVQHELYLAFIELGKYLLCPLSYLDLYLERRAVTCIAVSIPQTSKRFMQNVPRHPKPVQIEAARANLPPGHGVKALPAALLCIKKTIAVLVLHFL